MLVSGSTARLVSSMNAGVLGIITPAKKAPNQAWTPIHSVARLEAIAMISAGASSWTRKRAPCPPKHQHEGDVCRQSRQREFQRPVLQRRG